MIPKYKKQSMIGIPTGLLLLAGAFVVPVHDLFPDWARVFVGFAGVGLYCWGCAALAEAKGYSTAIVLTVVLGVLFPVVVLLALKDKHKYRR